jgi:hypothetical protein
MLSSSVFNFVQSFWQDEAGYILSAEAVLVGTIGVLGATVGMTAVAQTVNDEMTDVALAFRSLDQSFHIEGSRGCGAWTAGSCFKQRPVEESRAELAADIARWEKEAEEHKEQFKEKMDREHDKDVQGEMKKRDLGRDHQDMRHGDGEKPEMKKTDPKKPEMKKPEHKKPEHAKEEMKKEAAKKKHHHDDGDGNQDDN